MNELKNVDGTNSGLDADLLDGKHASEFAPAGKPLSIAVTFMSGYSGKINFVDIAGCAVMVYGSIDKSSDWEAAWGEKICEFPYYGSSGPYPIPVYHTDGEVLSTLVLYLGSAGKSEGYISAYNPDHSKIKKNTHLRFSLVIPKA